jgi:hypothetical protein
MVLAVAVMSQDTLALWAAELICKWQWRAECLLLLWIEPLLSWLSRVWQLYWTCKIGKWYSFELGKQARTKQHPVLFLYKSWILSVLLVLHLFIYFRFWELSEKKFWERATMIMNVHKWTCCILSQKVSILTDHRKAWKRLPFSVRLYF